MDHRSKLFSIKDIYNLDPTDDLFVTAMRENCRFQYDNCADYKKILDGEGFDPDSLKTMDDLADLPFIPTLIFKKRRLFAMSQKRMLWKPTSSGTSGSFSKIGLEFSALINALKMVLRVTPKRGVLSLRPCNYIVFGYKPNRHNKTAVAKTAFGTTLLAPALSRTYALLYRNGKYEPDLEGVIKAILKYSKRKAPLRFMGFPSYTFFVLKMMEERGLKVQLPKGSKIMMGGGWKQFYTEEVDKSVFYDLVNRVLGVKDSDIVEFFGAVEHPILYCDCPNHHFHVPVYSRILIRDIHTLKPVSNGTPGLINLMSPMVKATPILSVMTDDLGILHDGKECGCGQSSPYLEILGRVGLKDIKTCAAGAAELLNSGGKT